MARINNIQLRRGVASLWTSTNPVLASGEVGFETDTGKTKIGDGSTAWASLAYIKAGNADTVTTNANLSGDVTSVGNTTTIPTNSITNAKFRQSAALSVVGNSTNATANVGDITGSANQVLRVNAGGTALGFGAVDLSQLTSATGVLQSTSFPALTGDVTTTSGSVATTIANNAVTNAKAAQMAANTIKGNNTGATANATDLTATQATAMLNTFTTSLKGLVPSGGSSTTVVAGDATFRTVHDFIGTQVLTGGTTYTPTVGTTIIRLRMWGGGGGGGGASGGILQVGAASGGGSGSYLEKVVTGVTGTYTYSIGAAGTAGANTGGNGGNGGNTTFINGVTTYTAPGGTGGTGQTSGTTQAVTVGGSGGAISTNGDVNGSGMSGNTGYRASGTFGWSGNGGSVIVGGGGKGLVAAAAGNAATGFGAGGGGALSTANTNRAGGAGTAGLIIVEEYK